MACVFRRCGIGSCVLPKDAAAGWLMRFPARSPFPSISKRSHFTRFASKTPRKPGIAEPTSLQIVCRGSLGNYNLPSARISTGDRQPGLGSKIGFAIGTTPTRPPSTYLLLRDPRNAHRARHWRRWLHVSLLAVVCWTAGLFVEPGFDTDTAHLPPLSHPIHFPAARTSPKPSCAVATMSLSLMKSTVSTHRASRCAILPVDRADPDFRSAQ